MSPARSVYVVVPDGIDDVSRPSGGNSYDRRICRELPAIGWTVDERAVAGCWPHPSRAAVAGLAAVLARAPDGALVLLDGLIASAVPQVLRPEASRLRLVVLMHMPLDLESEGAALSSAVAVITTSAWTRTRLLERYGLPPGRVHVATPGVDAAPLSPGTSAGAEFLCVAAVTPVKGHDVLFAALSLIEDLPWRCLCVGALDRDRAFVERLHDLTHLGDRVGLVGPRIGPALDLAYAAADLLVVPSRAETYGMVITEALARGLPVVGSDVGGVSEAIGSTGEGIRPGLLVPANDPPALAAALRRWLDDSALRERLRRAARDRRTTLSGWSVPSDRIARVLAAVAG